MDELTPDADGTAQGPPAVPTEAVEPPPVKIAAAPEPPGPRRVGRGLSAVIVVIGLVAIGGIGVLGYSLSQDLAATRSSLATTESDLGSTKATLETTTADLGTTETSLAAAKAEHADLDGQIAELAAEVAQQTKCVTLQTDALAELGRISELQTANFNRTTEDSTWAKAETKRVTATGNALDAYYQAYSRSFDGARASARDWASKGAAAEAVIASQAKQQAAEFALIDAKAAEIETAINALADDLDEAESSCAEVAP